MVDNLSISCKKRSQILPPFPVGQIMEQDKSSRAARSEVFGDWKFKIVDVMVDEDSHSTDLSVSGEEAGLFNNFIGSLHFFVLNESKVI